MDGEEWRVAAGTGTGTAALSNASSSTVAASSGGGSHNHDMMAGMWMPTTMSTTTPSFMFPMQHMPMMTVSIPQMSIVTTSPTTMMHEPSQPPQSPQPLQFASSSLLASSASSATTPMPPVGDNDLVLAGNFDMQPSRVQPGVIPTASSTAATSTNMWGSASAATTSTTTRCLRCGRSLQDGMCALRCGHVYHEACAQSLDKCTSCRRKASSGFAHNRSFGTLYCQSAAQAKCCICLDTILLNGGGVFLGCGHVFHEECVSQVREKSCPMCRVPFRQTKRKRIIRLFLEDENSPANQTATSSSAAAGGGDGNTAGSDDVVAQLLKERAALKDENEKLAIENRSLKVNVADTQERLSSMTRQYMDTNQRLQEQSFRLNQMSSNYTKLQRKANKYDEVMKQHQELLKQVDAHKSELTALRRAVNVDANLWADCEQNASATSPQQILFINKLLVQTLADMRKAKAEVEAKVSQRDGKIAALQAQLNKVTSKAGPRTLHTSTPARSRNATHDASAPVHHGSGGSGRTRFAGGATAKRRAASNAVALTTSTSGGGGVRLPRKRAMIKDDDDDDECNGDGSGAANGSGGNNGADVKSENGGGNDDDDDEIVFLGETRSTSVATAPTVKHRTSHSSLSHHHDDDDEDDDDDLPPSGLFESARRSRPRVNSTTDSAIGSTNTSFHSPATHGLKACSSSSSSSSSLVSPSTAAPTPNASAPHSSSSSSSSHMSFSFRRTNGASARRVSNLHLHKPSTKRKNSFTGSSVQVNYGYDGLGGSHKVINRSTSTPRQLAPTQPRKQMKKKNKKKKNTSQNNQEASLLASFLQSHTHQS
ncbi:hypothetical protein PTSG_04331 [Salpingoeca rosetta]|uniref:RING-type domain-containing protein n=1 Tax=Salpingoeca rosetta (strain ATCC 50818 / BSB-021) TaxID=946362 RepID=F2U887_SALR5|nr:uncharacterized protein PTSG_04331 [Salpingoeca rosetta]EGD72595.1 hypothetical protein PTSG_04331 [Salpingoeca rosetta]|eukprot:XP_004994418.1 hypothetical protein PTSG_04331 [Salpingoeca rosetta]